MKEKKLPYLFKTFLLLGSTAFGGYMSLISMTRDKLVVKDKHIDDTRITEGLSIASILPGPVAVNVIAYIGYCIAGFSGAIVSIISVLLPSFFLVLILSILYFNLSDSLNFKAPMIGVMPVIVTIIFSVGFSMAKKICVKPLHFAITILTVLILFILKGYWVILSILFLAAFIGVIFFRNNDLRTENIPHTASWRSIIAAGSIFVVIWLVFRFLMGDLIEARVFTIFSQISLTLFGGGYVMVPILKSLVVEQLGWLNYDEFSYGISIGQITPGPILISSAFFGYKVAGLQGAILATMSIFFPSALLMILLSKVYLSVSSNPYIQSAMQAIKPAVAGMILYSAISLFYEGSEGGPIAFQAILMIVSFICIFKFNVNPVLLIIGGGISGVLLSNYI